MIHFCRVISTTDRRYFIGAAVLIAWTWQRHHGISKANTVALRNSSPVPLAETGSIPRTQRGRSKLKISLRLQRGDQILV
ncbi:MAG: hypothetical protein DMF04_05950 [Verrucomicrobia bacterium]|nr:MAG: hypothetical protein DMF04_05950 [Verrucomicrobiota bacterium]